MIFQARAEAGFLGCFFRKVEPKPVHRAEVESQLTRRLGTDVVRNLAETGTRDIMTLAEPEVARDAFNRRAFSEERDADGFVALPLALGGTVEFSGQTQWALFDAAPGSSTLLTALEPRDFARAVAELYDLALLRAHGRRPSALNVLLPPGLGVARRKKEPNVFVDEKTGEVLLVQTPFEIGTKETFVRLDIPLPRASRMLGSDYLPRDVDSLSIVTDARGRVLGVAPRTSEAEAWSRKVALNAAAMRPETLAEAKRIEARREFLTRVIPEFQERFRNALGWHDEYYKLKNAIHEDSAELRKLEASHEVYRVAREIEARRQQILATATGPRHWRPSQHLTDLYWLREEGTMPESEKGRALAILRRAEHIALGDADLRKLLGIMPAGASYAEGFANAEKFLARFEKGRLVVPLFLK